MVRFGRLGDLVMLTPALRAVLDRADSSSVALLTTPLGARLLDGFDPRLTEIRAPEGTGLSRMFRRRATRRWISNGRFSHVWLMETAPKHRRLMPRVGPEVHVLPEDRGSDPHFAAYCWRLVRRGRGAPPWANLPVTERDRDQAVRVLTGGIEEGAGAGKPGPRSRGPILLHPGFSDAARVFGRVSLENHPKAWPVQRWADLARQLVDSGRGSRPRRVIAVPGPGELALVERISEAAGGALQVIPGTLELKTYVALIAQCALVVAPDTGPGHLAAAVGTPVVSLFAQRDPRDCAPFGPPGRVRVIRAEDIPGAETTGPDATGLAAIPVKRVLDACEALLDH